MRLPKARLDQVLARFQEVEARMSAASDGAEVVRLGKEYAELKPVAEAADRLIKLQNQRVELEAMVAGEDADMAELAREELTELDETQPALEREMALLLAPRDADENASAILEVRAGTGGDEAALFAGDLFRMYQRYAATHGWKLEVESESEGEAGGYKEIIASIEGDGVFGRLKFESGVHRVQRVPQTETQGRIHTSAATVAVLPEPEDVEIEINDGDIRIDTYRSSGAGGQHVNKTDSAVRITHLPTGIVVTSSEKSQHQNRARAMKVLKAKLYEQKRDALDAERSESRKSQVGSGDRSERIRTYNFPQARVTDHRINLTLYNLPKVIDGEALDDLINPALSPKTRQRGWRRWKRAPAKPALSQHGGDAGDPAQETGHVAHLAAHEAGGDLHRLARRDGEGGADGVGHRRAPLAHRLCLADGRIDRGLVLDLGVQLAARQHHHGRDPDP